MGADDVAHSRALAPPARALWYGSAQEKRGLASRRRDRSLHTESNNAPRVKQTGLFQRLLIASAVAAAGVLLAYLYVKANWDHWFEEAVQGAFTTLDVDNSGRIDSKELYAGVLFFYMKLKNFVKVEPPSRAAIMRYMLDADVDQSGQLDYGEFTRVMTTLSHQVFGRALTQLVLTMMCPFIASYFVRWVERNWSEWVRRFERTRLGLPLSRIVRRLFRPFRGLACIARRLPRTLPATILSGVMMVLFVPKFFSVLDTKHYLRG